MDLNDRETLLVETGWAMLNPPTSINDNEGQPSGGVEEDADQEGVPNSGIRYCCDHSFAVRDLAYVVCRYVSGRRRP